MTKLTIEALREAAIAMKRENDERKCDCCGLSGVMNDPTCKIVLYRKASEPGHLIALWLHGACHAELQA